MLTSSLAAVALRRLSCELAALWLGPWHAMRGPPHARLLHSPAEDLWATEVKLQESGKRLQVDFSTGESFRYPAELLRVESPAAEAPRDRQGRPKIVHGRRHVGIIDIEPVGSYAVRLQFDDMHGSGIYTWNFLHDLGRHKLSRAREYIRLLRRYGLSRDPPRSKRMQSKGKAGVAEPAVQ